MESFNESKKIIIPLAVTIICLFFPISFLAGIIFGYIGTVFYYKKFIATGKVNLLIFNLRGWEIHLHHWINGILFFIIVYLTGILPQISFFWIGAISGIILHDLYTDDVWYKVIYKGNNK